MPPDADQSRPLVVSLEIDVAAQPASTPSGRRCSRPGVPRSARTSRCSTPCRQLPSRPQRRNQPCPPTWPRRLNRRWPPTWQGFGPHITVQDKADPDVARRTLERLRERFSPFATTGQALLLWRYDGGPWTSLARFPLGSARTVS